MAHLFIFGLGYSAKRVRAAAEAIGWRVSATGGDGEFAFDDERAVRAALSTASHVLSSVPPADDGDPVLARYGAALTHRWLGYLSSTGVYGDTGGAWVDESAPTGTGRRSARAETDAAWLGRGARVFRLPGIYGPGRGALERVSVRRAHRIDLPGQVFGRIHVDDDLPASQNAIIEEACRLLGVAPPPVQSLDDASLSPQARAFWSENRRVANGKAKRVLGWRPRYPDYRSGLRACLRAARSDL